MLKKSVLPFIWTLMLFTSEMHAKCEKPAQGPRGPTGEPGAQGQSLSLSSGYASSYGDLQVLNSGNYFPLHFNHARVTPAHIAHPFNHNDTLFQVQKDGIYLIGWTFILSNDVDDIVSLGLQNVTHMINIHPFPQMETHLAANQTKVLSGQTIALLQAKTVVQFEILSQEGNLKVSPSLIVMQIDAD
ncbi:MULTISPECIES: hypothetical protein [Parachlamydia]|jgi:hypothetical protein|uniref:BclA C-terminal domain-containing protein n=2 Tax=Parachlamydia acanthamoebae TaxID=83552 RepID=F8L1A6_PARAV|nr:hypothetical protein [Parachlamydia acanthamoebae]EFB40654.1 hypothetical protein pah_c197o033 [Parachlamydia acanthamoebae str. Hall's coccus]KIA77264.1 hypothetical protein DB43_GQ00060 [Parachlamydia acanthamoebae]CCB87035.1 putative uncharacterized protein [Parachlamydia acanthamoebae UV-7]